MSLIPCDFCDGRVTEKLANVTWAWWRADNERVAYRQRLCAACYVANVAYLWTETQENPYSCPFCHTEPGDDMDACYCTAFVPGVGSVQLEIATCAVHAVEVRLRAQQGARLLPDRLSSSRGQGPGPLTNPVPSVWDQLGLRPHD